MASTFRALETGKSGLLAASINQDVTGQNITNANNTGYTRQRTVTSAKIPAGTGYVISQVYNKQVGQGVRVDNIAQTRSEYLDAQYRTNNSDYNYYTYRSQGLGYLTGVFNELDDDSSITISLKDFASAVSSFQSDPTSEEYRENLQQETASLAQNINYAYDELVDLWSAQNDSVSAAAQEINSQLTQIAQLNEQIARYERGGTTANDLRDQRNNLLDSLSGMVDITYQTNSDSESKVDVYIGGEAVVSGSSATLLDISTSNTANTASGSNYNVIKLNGKTLTLGDTNTVAGADEVLITSGELYAHMELVQSDTATNAGIPYYINQLNSFAQDIAKQVNSIISSGYTYPDDENGNISTTGIDLFKSSFGQEINSSGEALYYDAAAAAAAETTITNTGYPVYEATGATDLEGNAIYAQKTDGDGNKLYYSDASQLTTSTTGSTYPAYTYNLTAGTLELSDEVKQSVWNIGASGVKIDLSAATTNAKNSDVAAKLYTLVSGNTFTSKLNTFVTHLSITSNTTDGLLSTTESLTNSVNKQRSSLSGVSLNEEATNMIMYQQSYSASARYITTIDDMIDKLINGTGRVGI